MFVYPIERTSMIRSIALPFGLLCGILLAQDGTFDPSFNPTDQGMARYDGLHWSNQQGGFAGQGVQAMTVQPDGKLLVGGSFNGGTLAIEDPIFKPGIARLNSDGSQDVSFNAGTGFDGPIEVIVVQPDGKILVGGAFLNCQGQPRKAIARLNADGSLDTGFNVGSGAGGTVFEIALYPDGRVVLGGNFTLYNSFPANRIVRLQANGTYDPTFATGSGFNATVSALAVQADGKVLAGGIFTVFNGTPRTHMARVNSNGTLDVAYVDPTVVSGPDNTVTDVTIGLGGTSYWIGEFDHFNGDFAPVLKLDINGSRVAAFEDSQRIGHQARIHYDPVSNVVTAFGGQRIEKLHGTTGAPLFDYGNYHPDWYYETNCSMLIVDWIDAAVGPDGEVYRIDAVHTGILRVFNDLTLDLDFRPGSGLGWQNSTHMRMTMSPIGEVAIGGRINHLSTLPSMNGVYMPDYMYLDYFGEPDPAGKIPRHFEGSVNGIAALSFNRTVFYGNLTLTCGPGFGDADYVSTTMLLYDASTSSFTPMVLPESCTPGTYGPYVQNVIQLASDRILYMGVDECTGASRDIGRFNLNGTWDATYTTTDLGDELPHCAAEAPDGKVYVGGDFFTANGLTRNKLVRLLPNGGVDPAFDPLGGFDNRVSAIVVNPDGTLVCIGSFNYYRGVPVPHVVKLLPNGDPDPTFDPGTGIGNTPLCMVRYPDGRILIGGAIPIYDGHVVNGIVCINADGSIDETFDQGEGFRINNPTINGGMYGGGVVTQMVMQPDGRVVCLGEFHMYDGNGRNRLARLGTGTSLMVSARVFLEGAFDGQEAMEPLIPRSLLPLREPYRALGFTHVRGGSESTTGAVMQMQGPGAIIDWVLVELRDPQNPAQIIATRSGLLKADGWITDTDGQSPLRFPGLFMGQYHVAVRHRNHLGIMSEAPLYLGSQTIPIDFTGPNYGTYGMNAQKELNGVRMLWAGDVNRDGALKYVGQNNDRDPILVTLGGSTPNNTITGYEPEDIDLDGVVKYIGQGNDRDPILVNVGGATPNSVRQAQLP